MTLSAFSASLDLLATVKYLFKWGKVRFVGRHFESCLADWPSIFDVSCSPLLAICYRN